MRLLLLPVIVAAALAAGGIAGASPDGVKEILPDLDQRAPGGLLVETVAGAAGPQFRLGFDSAVENHGAGPLVIDGRRASRAEPAMRADQLVSRADGTTRRVKAIGLLRYVVEADHRHWHYLDFDRYELRRAGDARVVLRDRKSGFCLGDRYRAGSVAAPVYVGRCGLNAPGLLHVREGITPGFGDDYHAHLEGQYLDVTGLPAGRYVLVHRVNVDRSIEESDYGNNAASMLLELAWPGGPTAPPSATPLAVCPDSDRCGG